MTLSREEELSKGARKLKAAEAHLVSVQKGLVFAHATHELRTDVVRSLRSPLLRRTTVAVCDAIGEMP